MSRVMGVSYCTYPSMDRVERTVVVVLVAGEVDDYAAYASVHEGGENEAYVEWTAQYGDKLSFEMACGHFPGGQLKRGRYRI